MMIQSTTIDNSKYQKISRTQVQTPQTITPPATPAKEQTASTESAIVEISAEGLEKSKAEGTSTVKSLSTTETTSTEKTVVLTSSQGDTAELSAKGMQASQKPKDASVVTDSLSNASSDEDTTNLSQYTEAELKTMLAEGTITRSEYNEEISSREASDETDTKTSTEKAALAMLD